MGALAIKSPMLLLTDALNRFQTPKAITIRRLGASNPSDAISALATWLKSWRSHGRTGSNPTERSTPGFSYAKQDHDIAASHASGAAFRPALGLPIMSKYGEWHESFDGAKARRNPRYKGEGRFASPVLLRPYRDGQGNWHALVIFVDAHKWPDDPATGQPKQVFLNGRPRAVSLELYMARKNDPSLASFP